MTATRTVAVLVGSLRAGSFTRKVARAIESLAPASLKFDFLEIGQLAHYNQDDETTPSPAYEAFRDRVRQADAVLFATPEYNRSVPGVLKNALDIASRPYGKGALVGKPAAVVSVSPGALGAFGANHHLRQSLVFLNMPTLAQPEAYIGGAATLFDEQGALKNDGTRDFLQKFVNAFAAWIELTAPKAAA